MRRPLVELQRGARLLLEESSEAAAKGHVVADAAGGGGEPEGRLISGNAAPSLSSFSSSSATAQNLIISQPRYACRLPELPRPLSPARCPAAPPIGWRPAPLQLAGQWPQSNPEVCL